MSILLPSRRFLLGAPWLIDPDARDFIRRVEAADGAALENGVKLAYSNFIRGCKADGIWSAIKASCILAGARTLSGALTPIAETMPAPTNFNFVSGDYDRKTGLVGNGSTKYLDSNRNNNADPQNNQHVAVRVSTVATSAASGPTVAPAYIGAGGANSGAINIGRQPSNSTSFYSRNRNSVAQGPSGANTPGFYGASRSVSSSYVFRASGNSSTINSNSQSPYSGNIGVFRSGAEETDISYVNGRIAFYSIGESLDLALLDARVTALINQLAAAIP